MSVEGKNKMNQVSVLWEARENSNVHQMGKRENEEIKKKINFQLLRGLY